MGARNCCASRQAAQCFIGKASLATARPVAACTSSPEAHSPSMAALQVLLGSRDCPRSKRVRAEGSMMPLPDLPVVALFAVVGR